MQDADKVFSSSRETETLLVQPHNEVTSLLADMQSVGEILGQHEDVVFPYFSSLDALGNSLQLAVDSLTPSMSFASSFVEPFNAAFEQQIQGSFESVRSVLISGVNNQILQIGEALNNSVSEMMRSNLSLEAVIPSYMPTFQRYSEVVSDSVSEMVRSSLSMGAIISPYITAFQGYDEMARSIISSQTRLLREIDSLSHFVNSSVLAFPQWWPEQSSQITDSVVARD